MEVGNFTDSFNYSYYISFPITFMDGPMLSYFDTNDYNIAMGQIAIEGALFGILSFFGIIGNIINTIVFYRIGFRTDSCHLSLGALALSDFGCCVLTLWNSVGIMVMYTGSFRLYYIVFDINHFGNELPKYMVTQNTQMTCGITAYIALERCISVTFPFKVKSIFTTKRSRIVTSCIFIVTFIFYIPYTFAAIPTMKYYLKPYERVPIFANKYVIFFMLFVNTIGLRFITIMIVIICNVIIFWKVRLSKKFRKTTASAGKSIASSSVQDSNSSKVESQNVDAMSKMNDKNATNENKVKETKLLRMIIIISTMFVICYIPELIYVTLNIYSFYFGFSIGLPKVIYKIIATCLETINSSCNIVVYYKMSTQYKQIIGRRTERKMFLKLRIKTQIRDTERFEYIPSSVGHNNKNSDKNPPHEHDSSSFTEVNRLMFV